MARGVPPGYTQFLRAFLDDLPALVLRRMPSIADQLRGASLLSSDYQVALSHPMMSSFLWSFRQNKITRNRESKTFNVEFAPRHAPSLSRATVERVWKEAGLPGQVGFDGSEFFFQLEWGYGRQTERLVHDVQLIDKIRNWAIDAASIAITLVEEKAEMRDQPYQVERDKSTASPLQSGTPHRSLPSESLLEDLIISHWTELFDDALEYVDRQVHCGPVGILDILARDRRSSDYVVIELKKGSGDDAVFGQLARYMGWIKENKAEPAGVAVRGIIVASEMTQKLRSAALSHPHVELVCYDFAMALHKDSGTLDFAGLSDAVPGVDEDKRIHMCACGSSNLEEARFCGHCGKENPDGVLVDAAGPSFLCVCGASNRAVARFCANCGKPVSKTSGHQVSLSADPISRTDTTPSLSDDAALPKSTFVPAGAVGCRDGLLPEDADQAVRDMWLLDGGTTIGEKVARDLKESNHQWVRLTTVHQLSKWCHPQRWTRREKRMYPAARRVSQLLFGFVVARMIEPEAHCGGPIPSSDSERGWLWWVLIAIAIVLLMLFWRVIAGVFLLLLLLPILEKK